MGPLGVLGRLGKSELCKVLTWIKTSEAGMDSNGRLEQYDSVSKLSPSFLEKLKTLLIFVCKFQFSVGSDM